ncbi:MAG TPA: hypothetical protein VGK70_08715 [Thermoanaerobaculia bacterium]|jgi:hypothetical protein
MSHRPFRPLTAIACLALSLGCSSAGPAAPSAPESSFAGAPPRFAELDGYRVRYKSLGSGREALVFIHGWSGDLDVWAP